MLLFDRRYIACFDWLSFLLILILSTVGLTFVYSATYNPINPCSVFFKKQFFGVLTGLIIYFFCSYCDFRTLERYGYFFYFFTISLLLFTLVKGTIGMGAKRWINLGFFSFQPSELAKLFFPSFLSYYLFGQKIEFNYSFSDLWPILACLIVTFGVVLKQPDLGTALILLFSGFILLWFAGLKRSFFVTTLLLCLITAPIIYANLKNYQKARIQVFLGAGELHKERYQIEQSRIAIGSGGLWGKGFLNGTQNKFLFLPESRTDFIFAVICEELGFVGAILLILVYILLFIRISWVIATINNPYAQILACGLVIHLLLSTLINISMVIGLMPIVGIPLPFISYGITNLWISFASIGCFNSIAVRRFYLSMARF